MTKKSLFLHSMKPRSNKAIPTSTTNQSSSGFPVIESIEEIEKAGFCTYDEDSIILENNLLQILKDKGLSVSALSAASGIPRQNLNAIAKSKFRPGVDSALKIGQVLGVPVEDIFSLGEDAWITPYRTDDNLSQFIDTRTLELIDNDERKKRMGKDKKAYINIVTRETLSKIEKDKRMKQYIDEHFPAELERVEKINPDWQIVKTKSTALKQTKANFEKEYSPLFKKVGKKVTPYYLIRK